MQDATQTKQQKPIQILRDRCGGMSDDLKAYYKDQVKLRKALTEVLGRGPVTIPELAQTTGIDGTEVMWHVMAMRKYGKVRETGLSGDYYRYELKEESDGNQD